MTLRDYQQNAVDYATQWVKYKDEPAIIVMPTGSGKTHVIAELTKIYYEGNQRVAVIAHRKELLSQNGSKMAIPFGYCSASIGEKDLNSQVIIGGIQSIYNKQFEPFDVIIIDECHRIPNGDEGQYWQFIKKSPNAKLIGLTATPYRLKGGKLGWGHIVYDVSYAQLIKQKYLTPLVNKVKADIDLSEIKVTAGDYNIESLSYFMEDPALIDAAIKNIIAYGADRNSVLIFCVSVGHAKVLTEAMQKNGMESAVISGKTNQGERDSIIEDFKEGRLRHLINCEVLLEGFDAPNIDMIMGLRPTKSKGLWEQLMGRGVRKSEGKKDCLLIDMANNLREHGGMGTPYHEKSKKEKKGELGRICPECEEFVQPISASQCTACGYIFIKEDPPKASHSYYADLEASPHHNPLEEYAVEDVVYREHKKRGDKTKISLRVDYVCPMAKYGTISEWLSPWSSSDWAKNKAWEFFRDRGKEIHISGSDDISFYDVETLLIYCQELRKPASITVDYSDKYPRIKEYTWHEESRAGDTEGTTEVAGDLLEGDIIPF